MNNNIISYQNHRDIKREFSDNIKDKLNYISYKKKNNITDNLKKNDNNSEGSSQLLSQFEKFFLKTHKLNKNIRNNCSEKELCNNEIALVITMPQEIVDSVDNSGLLIENSGEPIVSNNHTIDVHSVFPNYLPVVQESIIPKEKADRPLKDTIALLQLKSSSDLRFHNKNEDSELSSKDIISESVDFIIQDQLVSDNNKMQNLGCLINIDKFDSIDIPVSTTYNTYQQLSARTNSITENAHYMEKGMVKILKIQMNPDSPDNVIATFCLSGDKLSIKLQVEASYIYKKIQNERQDILDALNFSAYTIDSLDIDFVQKDTANFYQYSLNSNSKEQSFAQSGSDRRRSYFSKRESVDENILLTADKSKSIYRGGEIIGKYSGCIYV